MNPNTSTRKTQSYTIISHQNFSNLEIPDSDIQRGFTLDSCGEKKDRWKLLRNVVKAISLMKIHNCEAPEIADLLNEIRQIPTDQAYRQQKQRNLSQSAFRTAIEDVRREQRVFMYAERGGPEDLEALTKELEEDPYRYLRMNSHPLSLVNKRGLNQQTPLYVAAKNGNYEVCKLLLEFNADHLLTSQIENEQETALEVAGRWGYTKVINVLLTHRNWPKGILKKALAKSTTTSIRKLLRSYIKARKYSGCSCFTI
jgi:hypothetical protein